MLAFGCPWLRLLRNDNFLARFDTRIQGDEVGLLRDGLVLHHQKHFDYASNTRGSFSMTDAVLNGAEKKGTISPRICQRKTDALIFYRVSHLCSCIGSKALSVKSMIIEKGPWDSSTYQYHVPRHNQLAWALSAHERARVCTRNSATQSPVQ